MHTREHKRALIAMSGGVDSSVTAALMMEEGYDCIGANMRLFSAPEAAVTTKSCCSIADALDARRVADSMGMPFYVLHYVEEFHKEVIDKFVRCYLAGITPNPCIDCNRHLKFTHLLEAARE
ncbi:MAG: tRNA 2-thiouridine(34) synthase MnmA, partial [Selenomonadaceae bacterium]|nr:tRNA 2-thiouridine(34) synthase MnmA [Selenomonadaceae bacterium]